MSGKEKCKYLREIRKKIALENDITLVTSECTFKGECKGTCPKCEAEVRYLVAFLPVNQPYTMTPEQCIAAAKVIGPKVLIPYHYSRTDLSALPESLPGMDVRIRQMQ